MGKKMNDNNAYIVATVKPWNIKVYNEIIRDYSGKWYLITDKEDLSVEKVEAINPMFIFFPHWSHIVPEEILNMSTCVCFHETDLPYGRGGSPLQNLISLGHRETVITALKMTEELDAGPVYLKKKLSLEGIAEEIFIRASYTVAEMIKKIIEEEPEPIEQVGEAVVFRRRKPNQSKIEMDKNSLGEIFDHIRMLDADGYPRSFLEFGGFRYEFSRPALKSDEILADVRITKIEGE